MQLKSVVLPAPFGPIRPTIERSSTSKANVRERLDAAEPQRQPAHPEQRLPGHARASDSRLNPARRLDLAPRLNLASNRRGSSPSDRDIPGKTGARGIAVAL